ncbi:hypothetical protein [Ensifer aridi]|uniref:hypothetical protein n=1 Tax=Ensifer aridi TaxID=1708715 RepID=UPI000A11F1C2|nr:hypothetical protein [Ensifer aridi]
MTDDRFPRAKVRTSDDGTMTVRFMQNGWERVFIFAGNEGRLLLSAIADALANPGFTYDVSWDDEART